MKIKQPQFTIGADPEFLLRDVMQGKIVSSIPVLRHDKHDPIHLGDGILMYADNVLVETAFPPVETKEEAINRFRDVFKRMQDRLGKSYRLVPKACHFYDTAEIGVKPKVMKGRLPTEWEIGCNPSYNVYTKAESIPTPFTDGLRTGSFHIHIGNAEFGKTDDFKLSQMADKENAIRLMDIFVGTASVLFDRDPTAKLRRSLYGKAGEFRPTDYGVEYRPLGNYALGCPKLVELVFDLTMHAMGIMANNEEFDVLGSMDDEITQQAINDCDKTLAKLVLQSAETPPELVERCMVDHQPDFARDWKLVS